MPQAVHVLGLGGAARLDSLHCARRGSADAFASRYKHIHQGMCQPGPVHENGSR